MAAATSVRNFFYEKLNSRLEEIISKFTSNKKPFYPSYHELEMFV